MDTILKIGYFRKRDILMARIRVNGIVKDKSTGIRMAGETFDFRTKRFHKKSPNSIAHNKALSQFEMEVYDSIQSGRPIVRTTPDQVTLMSIIDEYISLCQTNSVTSKRSNTPLSEATKKSAKSILLGIKSLGVDFCFSECNASTYGAKVKYQGFISQLKGAMMSKGWEHSTVWARLALLKGVIKTICERYDIELGNLLSGMVIKYIPKDVVVITHPQVEWVIRNYSSIRESCCTDKMDRTSLDYWVTALVLNARKADMLAFTKDNLYHVNDKMWIRYRPNKTKNSSGVVVNVPVPEVLVDIFTRNINECGRPLPHTPDPSKIPDRIKSIAKRTGMFDQMIQIYTKGNYVTVPQWQTLHLHKMRASGMTDKLGMGMPEALVKAYSGHTADSKSFRRYVNIHDEAKEKFSSMYFSSISSSEASDPPQKEAIHN